MFQTQASEIIRIVDDPDDEDVSMLSIAKQIVHESNDVMPDVTMYIQYENKQRHSN